MPTELETTGEETRHGQIQGTIACHQSFCIQTSRNWAWDILNTSTKPE